MLDVSAFKTYKLREFCMQHFPLKGRICERWEMQHFKRPAALRTKLERMLFGRSSDPLEKTVEQFIKAMKENEKLLQ